MKGGSMKVKVRKPTEKKPRTNYKTHNCEFCEKNFTELAKEKVSDPRKLLRDHLAKRDHCWRQENYDRFPAAERSALKDKKNSQNRILCWVIIRKKCNFLPNILEINFGPKFMAVRHLIKRRRCQRKIKRNGRVFPCNKRYAVWFQMTQHWRKAVHKGCLPKPNKISADHPGDLPPKKHNAWWPEDDANYTDPEDDDEDDDEDFNNENAIIQENENILKKKSNLKLPECSIRLKRISVNDFTRENNKTKLVTTNQSFLDQVDPEEDFQDHKAEKLLDEPPELLISKPYSISNTKENDSDIEIINTIIKTEPMSDHLNTNVKYTIDHIEYKGSYQIKLPKTISKITLGDLKKHQMYREKFKVYRYFLKTIDEDGDEVWQEFVEDSALVPSYKNKIFIRCESSISLKC